MKRIVGLCIDRTAAIARAGISALGGFGGQALAQPAQAAAAQKAAPAEGTGKADPRPTLEVTGTLVGIDEGDLIIDLGSDSGLSVGAKVEIWRPLKLKHPVTGKVFSDRFKIGELSLIQVRKGVSL